MLVCERLETVRNIYGGYDCAAWVEYTPLFSDLAQLTYKDASALLSVTCALFALAWALKHVNFFARRT